MQNRLFFNTVSPNLLSALEACMCGEVFKNFRLVGGTSLSLQLGHRMSVDIDLFTDALYGSIDFKEIEYFLNQHFSYVSTNNTAIVGMGRSYFVGRSVEKAVKIDIYYTDPFINDSLEVDGIRMATLEEIIAMKLDVVLRGGRKKDFWDIHELIPSYSFAEMLDLHLKRYPYNHNPSLIRKMMIEFDKADADFDPKCLRGKHWDLIKLDLSNFANK